MAKAPTPGSNADESIKEYTVAPQRTVSAEDRDYGPGEKVILEEAEGTRLTKLGYLVGEDGSVAIPTNGPAVNVEDGVQIEPAS